MAKSTTFHITLSPSGDVKNEINEKGMKKYIKENSEEYIFSYEHGDSGKEHLHIGVILTNERRQDKFRESILKYCNFNKGTLIKRALVVKVHWDFDYLVGYLHKEGNPHIKSFDDEKYIEECIKKYGTGKGEYHGEKRPKSEFWSYDKIVISFSQWLCEQKRAAYCQQMWEEFLRRNIKYILPSTHARIRRDPLIEWVDAYVKNYYNGGDRDGDVTKDPSPYNNKKRSNSFGNLVFNENHE